jgi:murein DD-endopeptidase MepM/ murein hydrolase activator NlpD
MDFRAPIGMSAKVTAPGVVVKAGWNGGYGRMVEVDHGNGFSTRYGHLSEIDVTVGEKLDAGAVIGKTGSSGRSTGPHLHYEVRHNGEAIDPLRFLTVGKEGRRNTSERGVPLHRVPPSPRGGMSVASMASHRSRHQSCPRLIRASSDCI